MLLSSKDLDMNSVSFSVATEKAGCTVLCWCLLSFWPTYLNCGARLLYLFYSFDFFQDRQTNVKFTYSFILLEELERKWQMMPNNSAVAFANAKKVSLLVKGKFFPSILEGV